MKYRSDFVTNSSSSSFITVQIESKTLSEIIKRFQLEVCPKLYDEDVDLTEEDFNGYTYALNNSNVDGDVVTYTEQDGYIYEAPKNLKEALNTFISLFDTEYAIISRKGCVPKIDFEEENPLPKNSQIAKEILLRSKEIFDDFISTLEKDLLSNEDNEGNTPLSRIIQIKDKIPIYKSCFKTLC